MYGLGRWFVNTARVIVAVFIVGAFSFSFSTAWLADAEATTFASSEHR